MRSSPWLPSATGEVHKSSDLYILSDWIHDLLSDNANYLHARITNKDFIATLSVKKDMTFEVFKNEFSKWITKPTFTTSREHISNVYNYFMNHPTEITSLLDKPFIFLPRKQNNNSRIIEGQFHKVEKVSWKDPSGIFRKMDSVSTRKILRDFYPDSYREFFLKIVMVDEYPSGEEYLRLITNITASVTVLPNKEKCFEIFMLMAVLAETFLYGDALDAIHKIGYPSNIFDRQKLYDDLKDYFLPGSFDHLKNAMINDKVIFPTAANIFVSLKQQPILVFNRELAKIYKSKSVVPMIFADDIYNILKERQKYIADANSLYLKVLVFFKVCKLYTLKELYIEPEIITEGMDRGCAYWEKILHDIAPILQRYIASLLPDLYKEKQTKVFVSNNDKECKFSEYLKNSNFFSVRKLEVIYHLKEREDVNIKLQKVSNVELTNSKAMIYISKTAVDSKECYDKILLEILRLFTDDEDQQESLFDFITTYNDVQDKDSFLRRKKIVEIKDEEMWSFPEPRFKELKTSKPTPQPKTQTPEVLGTSSTEKRLTCWPPQKPGMGLGLVAKPDTIKEDERKVFEKWGFPDAFSNSTQTTRDEVVDEKEKAIQLAKGKHKPVENAEEKLKENKPNIVEVVLDKKGQTTQPVPAKFRPEEHVKGKIKEEKPEQYKRPTDQKIISQETAQIFLTKETKRSQSGEEIVKATRESRSNNEEKLKLVSSPLQSSCDAETKPTFNPDKFITTCLDGEMEDLPVDQNYVDILKQFNKTGADSNEFTKLIGKIGEEIIYKYLCDQYDTKLKSRDISIEWINCNNEAGQPYDIKITQSDGKMVYIEVKSTGGHEKKEFEISSQQLKFALEQGSNFHLYRVSGLTSKSKLTRLVNLSMYMDHKTVKLYMIV